MNYKNLVLPVCAALLTVTANAQEVQIKSASFTTNFTISSGLSVRMEDPSADSIWVGNGTRNGETGSALAATQDDGNLNFEKGDIVNAPVTVIGDFDYNVEDEYGLFVRVKAVQDLALTRNEVKHGHSANNYAADSELDDSDFETLAQFSHMALLDSFVYSSFELGEKPVDLRVGRQVVSWGEGLFIQGGINGVNPLDASAFRRPGTELKEGLIPLGMVYGNVGMNDSLSIEGFWAPEWRPLALDGCGTFFSTNDVAAEGCDQLSLATFSPQLDDSSAQATSRFMPRGKNVEPDSMEPDNFGLAARFFADNIDTEFGFYLTQLDSRRPNISYRAGDATVPPTDALPLPLSLGSSQYVVEYAENIQTFGLSASTNLGGLAVAAELSYRPNQPVQINTSDTTAAALFLGRHSLTLDGGVNPADALFADVAPGTLVSGYVEAQQIKGQVSTIAFFDRALGASRVAAVFELGFESLNADNPLELNLGRASIYGAEGTNNSQGEGFYTDFSAGFRSRFGAAYPNVFNGINLTPQLSIGHDISGYSSDGQFVEGRTTAALSLGFDYLNRYEGSLSYNTSFGGDYFAFDDRDFLSAIFRVKL